MMRERGCLLASFPEIPDRIASDSTPNKTIHPLSLAIPFARKRSPTHRLSTHIIHRDWDFPW